MEYLRKIVAGAAVLSMLITAGCTPTQPSVAQPSEEQEQPTAVGTGGPATDAPLPAWYFSTPDGTQTAQEEQYLYQEDNNEWKENGFTMRTRMFIARGINYGDRFTSCVWDCADELVNAAMKNQDFDKAFQAASNTSQAGYRPERRITLSSQPVFIGTYASATVTCRAEVILVPSDIQQEEVVYYSSTDNASTVYDLASGREVELSDLFFDGVDYLSLLTAQTLGQDANAPSDQQLEEDSFDFALRGNSLYLHFVRGNPYFLENSRDYYIPLSQLQGLSPVLYTDFRDVLSDASLAVPCWLQVPVNTIQMENSTLPLLAEDGKETTQHINEQLKTWYATWEDDAWIHASCDTWPDCSGQSATVTHQVSINRLGNYLQARSSHQITCGTETHTCYDARVWDVGTGENLTPRQLISEDTVAQLLSSLTALLDSPCFVLTEDCHIALYDLSEQNGLQQEPTYLPISDAILEAQSHLLS